MYYWRGPFIRSLAIYGNDDSAPWLPPIYQYIYAHTGVQCTLYSVHFGPGSRYVDRPRVMNFEGVPCVKGLWKRFLGHIIHRVCTDRVCNSNCRIARPISSGYRARTVGSRAEKFDERRRVLNRTTTTAIKYCQEDRARCSRLASFVPRPRRKLSFKPKTALNILWYGIQAAGGRNGK